LEKIILSPEVVGQLNLLIKILYEREYFGFMDTAHNYADNIYDFIFDIPNNPYKKSYNNKLGTYFSSYKANKNTTWYILFDTIEDRFFVQNITNNHSADYAYIISVIK
jgi:hypothetical protein